MPLYEYQCGSCQVKTEELQSMSEDPLTLCVCGGKLDRLIGHASIGLCNTNMLRSARQSIESFDDPNEFRGERLRQNAKAAGISTAGKWYDPSLALYVGDPTALVGSIEDIKDVCKMRGWTTKMVEGELKIEIPADLSKTPREQFGGVKCTS